MIANDLTEKDRIDARNALEEFVYDMRDKLQEESQLAVYVLDAERLKICEELNNLENWLYEEGEDCDRQVYKDKLNNLHEKTNPIKNRCNEYENHPQAFVELGHAIQLAKKAVDEFLAGDLKYEHLSQTEILNVQEKVEKVQKWLEDVRGKVSTSLRTSDPPVKLQEIHQEYQSLTSYVNSILKRPKPTPPPPQPTPQEKEQQNNSTTDNKNGSPPQSNVTQENEMDVE